MALLGFWGFVASYAMRVNLSVAIVAMVRASNKSLDTNTSQSVCHELIPQRQPGGLEYGGGNLLGLTGDDPNPGGEFDWDDQQQGIILGSFFWGYVLTQVPGGMIAERIGGKWPFGIGMFITAIFSLLTPIAARTGMGALIFVRVVQGLGEGVTNPAMHALLARWVPPLERSKFSAYIYAGKN